MVYIRLFHGRTDPNQDMDDWGSDGPVFGPYQYVHTTYNCHLRLGKSDDSCDELQIVEPDMLYYDGVYYGDWSIFGEDEFKTDGFKASVFNPANAKPPKIEKRKVKIIVYVEGGVCYDVKTNITEGLWDYALVDYDNNPELPDDYMPFSEKEMKPIFL